MNLNKIENEDAGVARIKRPNVINTEGTAAEFSVDRYTRDAVSRGMKRKKAIKLSHELLAEFEKEGIKQVTTDKLRHFEFERDPIVLSQTQLARVSRRETVRENTEAANPVDAVPIGAPPTADTFVASSPIELNFDITIQGDRVTAQAQGKTIDVKALLREQAIDQVLSDKGGVFLIEGEALLSTTLFADITNNMKADDDLADQIKALLGKGTASSAEQIRKDIADKQKLLDLLSDDLDRLAKEMFLEALGPAAVLEGLRRKFGEAVVDKLAKEAAEKAGFKTAAEAAKIGGRKYLIALLKLAKGANYLTVLLELGLISRSVYKYISRYGEYDRLYAALWQEHKDLKDPALVISPGERTGVGAGIGPRKGCRVFVEFVTEYIDDSGDLKETKIAPTHEFNDTTVAMEFLRNVKIPAKGKFQFFIVQIRIQCPNKEDRVLVVSRQAVDKG